MPGPYSVEQKAVLAKRIDSLLGTTAASTDGHTVDLMLDWFLAIAERLEELEDRDAT